MQDTPYSYELIDWHPTLAAKITEENYSRLPPSLRDFYARIQKGVISREDCYPEMLPEGQYSRVWEDSPATVMPPPDVLEAMDPRRTDEEGAAGLEAFGGGDGGGGGANGDWGDFSTGNVTSSEPNSSSSGGGGGGSSYD